MHASSSSTVIAASPSRWLKSYYFLRFMFSAIWVAAAFTVAKASMPLAAFMLIAYPAWDAFANFIDARRSGGLARNRSQLLNLAVSTVTAIAAAVALGSGLRAAFAVFGVWAALSGLCQLVTAVRRRKTAGAQWTMILSGAQSTLAGFFFEKMAHAAVAPTIATFAPYAAFGAFYFLLSALWLAVTDARAA